MRVRAEELQAWAAAVAATWGYRPEDAAYLAHSLVDANLRGTDSHGVMRLPTYRARIEAGLVNPAAEPQVVRRGAVVVVDAAGAPGQLAARAAVTALIEASDELGAASAVVRGSAHFGTAGFYARELAAQGKIGVVVSNSEPIVVPFGGRDALLGTNPVAIAAPGPDGPVCLDMATSTTAMGRVLVAAASGQEIPADWGVDATGVPTTDPNAVTALLPAAGPKGYGLAFMVEVLAGVLSGSGVAAGVGNQYEDFGRPQNVGHFLLALDVAHFLPLATFETRMAELVGDAHATAPAPGFDRVLAPGEPEAARSRQRAAEGVDLPPATAAELAALARDAGVDFPEEQ